MTDSLEATIPFKGDRSYAQIADIFTAMVEASGAGAGQSLVFSVHAPLFTPFVRISHGPAAEARPEAGLAARLDFLGADGTRRVAFAYGLERDAAIPRRDFDEDALRARIRLDGPEAVFDGETDSDFAELITAMNKKLLQSLFPSEGAKWWAVRLQLARMPADWSRVRLQCKTPAPARLYNSKVEVDGLALGEINFVLRPL